MRERGVVLSVTIDPAGDELAVDVSAGATAIEVTDTADFYEPNVETTLAIGSETIVYTEADADTDIITLATPLANAYTAGEEVYLNGHTVYAKVRVGETVGDPYTCIVPSAIIDQLGGNVYDLNGKSVTVEEDPESDDIVVLWIDDELPEIDGTYIDPTTLPAAEPDGNPPPAVTEVVAIGGKGFLSVRWGGVTNPDNFPVRYELHMSETPAFTAVFNDTATLVVDTNANIATVDKLPPDSTGLDYFEADGITPKLYYFSVIAYDEDGPASPSPVVSAAMNQTIAADVAVRSITGELFAAEVVLSTMFASPGLTGARIQMGLPPEAASANITAFDETEQPTAQINSDGSPHFFKGTITADVAQILQAILSGTGHQLTPGSTLTMTGTTQAPAQAPTVSGDNWATQQLDEDDFNDLKRGFYYDSSSNHFFYGLKGFGPFPVQGSITEVDTSGATIGVHLPDDGIFILGITKQGTDWWILGEDQNGVLSHDPDRFIIGRYNSSWVLQNSWIADLTSNPDVDPAFGYDAVDDRLMVAYATSTGLWRIDNFQRFTTGVSHSPDSAVISGADYGGSGAALAAVMRVTADLGASRYVVAGQNTSGNQPNVRVMSTSGVDQPNEYWPIANGARLAGMVYDGTNFIHLSINSTKGNIVTYSRNYWKTESSKWWFKNTLYDGTFETDPSPAKSFTMTKRGRVVLAADVPAGDADQIRVYAGRGASAPADSAMFRQTDPGVGNNLSAKYDMINFAAASTLATARTPFPAGTPSTIESASGGLEITSEGNINMTGGGDLVLSGGGTIKIGSAGTSFARLAFGASNADVAGGDGTALIPHSLGVTPDIVLFSPTGGSAPRIFRQLTGGHTSSVIEIEGRDAAGALAANGVQIAIHYLALAFT